jgi:hypothetical protein
MRQLPESLYVTHGLVVFCAQRVPTYTPYDYEETGPDADADSSASDG